MRLPTGPWYFFGDQSGQLILEVNTDTVQFEITSFTGVLLCSGVGAQLSNVGLVGRRGIDDELFPFSEMQFSCSSRVDLPDAHQVHVLRDDKLGFVLDGRPGDDAVPPWNLLLILRSKQACLV